MNDNLCATLSDILKAKERITSYINETPVITNATFDAFVGRKVFFKTENLQKTGSFKARGALNAVMKLKEENPEAIGVVTHSSGNHGQALAWSAKMAKLTCSVVVPKDSPAVKINAIKGYGADVVLCEPTPTSRATTCAKLEKEHNLNFISSYDHPDIIAGQGTIATEFLKQVPNLDAILVAASGGGMISGVSIAAKAIKPSIKVFMVEAEGKMCEESLRSGKRLWPNPPQYLNTIAHGIRLQQLGHLTWPIVLQLVEKDVFTVNDQKIVEGMKFSFERMKMVIEAASGAVVAAAMSEKMARMDPSIQNVGVILCGGNTDINNLPWY